MAWFLSQSEDGIRDLIVTRVQTCYRKSTRLNSSHDQISMPSSACDWSSDVCSGSEEHTSELQSRSDLVCRLLLEKKKNKNKKPHITVHSYIMKLNITVASRCNILYSST